MNQTSFINQPKIYIAKNIKTAKPEDIYNVWFSKTLEHFKGLFSTNVVDGYYIEVTYNGIRKEFYIDVYRKVKNELVPGSEMDKLELEQHYGEVSDND